MVSERARRRASPLRATPLVAISLAWALNGCGITATPDGKDPTAGAPMRAAAGATAQSRLTVASNASATESGRHITFQLERRPNAALTVVFENGLGGRLDWWAKVIPGIDPHASAFAYDRPGYGDSDAVTTTRDGAHIVDELRDALRANGLPPPYVLVGHSFGGVYMQYFARRYPGETAALILVDSTSPSVFASDRANWPPWYDRAVADARPVEREELQAISATGKAVLALPTITGKPVIVLSAAHGGADLAEAARAADRRREVARLYPGARQVWVDSGHGIPLEQPQAVIDAINEAIARVVDAPANVQAQ